jgi:anthranilate phosphoribosyltransferase
MKSYIQKIVDKENLSFTEAYAVMHTIMNGEVNNSHLAGFLIALKAKGETAAEIAGFAKAMREISIKVNVDNSNLIDVCGTGGDDSGTFNISTAAAFVVAGAGVGVAKHGNKSISSRSGSADVLVELGININLNPEQTARALQEVGISFLFAPQYHPAMKYAATVRKELGMKTAFNLLGPLTNPAHTRRQLIGVYNNHSARLMAEAAGYLDMEHVCFICTGNHRDEITLEDMTEVNEYRAGQQVRRFTIGSADFDYPKATIENLKGDGPARNAEIILGVLQHGIKNDAYRVVAANAALALYCAGFSPDLLACRAAAEASIDEGKAYEKLVQLGHFEEASQ